MQACNQNYTAGVQEVPAAVEDAAQDGEIIKLQQKQRMEIQRTLSDRGFARDSVHPDLAGLSFGDVDHDDDAENALQRPMRPTGPDSPRDERDHGLSDYSDYDSDDDATHRPPASSEEDSPGPSTRAVRRRSQQPSGNHSLSATKEAYADLLGSDDDVTSSEAKRGLIRGGENPFADPFADKQASRAI